jgi:hypothetical protein
VSEQAASYQTESLPSGIKAAAEHATGFARWVVESLAPEVTPQQFRDGLAGALRRFPG